MKVLVQNISSLRNINLEAMQLTGVIHSICPPVVFHLRQKGSKWLKKKNLSYLSKVWASTVFDESL